MYPQEDNGAFKLFQMALCTYLKLFVPHAFHATMQTRSGLCSLELQCELRELLLRLVVKDVFMGCFIGRELEFWPICSDINSHAKNKQLCSEKHRFKLIGWAPAQIPVIFALVAKKSTAIYESFIATFRRQHEPHPEAVKSYYISLRNILILPRNCVTIRRVLDWWPVLLDTLTRFVTTIYRSLSHRN